MSTIGENLAIRKSYAAAAARIRRARKLIDASAVRADILERREEERQREINRNYDRDLSSLFEPGSLSERLRRSMRMAAVITLLVEPNTTIVQAHSPFLCARECPLSLLGFATRIAQYSDTCPAHTFDVAIVLALRLHKMRPLLFHPLSVHKILCAVFVVAYKFVEDEFPVFKDMAHMLGVSTAELSVLERELVRSLDFNVFVTDDERQAGVQQALRLREHSKPRTSS